jgi:RNA polymerase sigma-70 factor (ECF subfamily)
VEVEIASHGRVLKELTFEEFFQAEYPGLVRALFLLTADRAEAEELAQEAMARVYERWDRVGMMDSPGGYVYRAAVNLNRQRLRHLAVRARRLLSMGVQMESAQSENPVEITEAIASLPLGQRQAFVLVEWLGMSTEEAGRLLRIAPASVRTRIHRARTALQDRLSHEGGNHG